VVSRAASGVAAEELAHQAADHVGGRGRRVGDPLAETVVAGAVGVGAVAVAGWVAQAARAAQAAQAAAGGHREHGGDQPFGFFAGGARGLCHVLLPCSRGRR
jgi:hypothetical protein